MPTVARTRVIFATKRPPVPLDNGARIRTQRLAAGLARRCDVTLVSFHDGPRWDDTEIDRAALEAALPGVELVLLGYGRPHPPGARRGALRRGSVTWSHFATPSLRHALQDLTARHPGAVVHLDDPGVGLAGTGLGAALTAFAPHNVEHRIVAEVAARRGVAHRPFLALEARRIAAEERRLWRAADLCLAVSEVDAATMRAGGARAVELCPNGSDDVEALPPAPGGPLVRLLFVGTGDFWPYELGLAHFARDVLPGLRAAGPVALDVVGTPPPDPVRAPEVTYHGRVPDVRGYYERAHALVIPVFEGSGTRLKAVEAARLGRAVVSTALGVEGLPLRAGEHFLRAERPEDWVAAVARLRERPQEVAAMAAAAREATEALLWPRIADALADRYEAVYRTKTR